jgi:hypothetical protein
MRRTLFTPPALAFTRGYRGHNRIQYVGVTCCAAQFRLYLSVIEKIVVSTTPRNNGTPVFEKTPEVRLVTDSSKPAMHKERLSLPVNTKLGVHIQSKLQRGGAGSRRSHHEYRFNARN